MRVLSIGNKFPKGFCDSQLYFDLKVEAILIKLDLLEFISCYTLETALRKRTEREGFFVSGGLCETRILSSVFIGVLFCICCLLGVNVIAFFFLLITFILIKPQSLKCFFFYSASGVMSFLLCDTSLYRSMY